MREILLSTLLLAAVVSMPGALASDGSTDEIPCAGSPLNRVLCIADKAVIFASDVAGDVIGLVCYEVPELC